MNENEFRLNMQQLADKYPVDTIDPRVGSGSWVDKHVEVLKSRQPDNSWNPLLARQYFEVSKKSIEDFVRTRPNQSFDQ